MERIKELYQRVANLPYPECIKDRHGEITGPAFFPGGSGLTKGDRHLRARPFMILGHDQDNLIGFEETLKRTRTDSSKGEQYSSTWRNLLNLLAAAGISEEDCFFTNAIAGIRKTESNTGRSPAFNHPDFIRACVELLTAQIEAQRPTAIVCLGLWPFRLLSLLSKKLAYISIGCETLTDLDKVKGSYLVDVHLDSDTTFHFTVAVVCHPSFRPINAKNRRVEGLESASDAEIEILKRIKKRASD